MEDIKHKKVLMVGAGGIGCELLKTLVLTGFDDIEMIDMDTIETSNLNRQFLFRKRHVGSSKAQVALESVQRFRPEARIVAHFDNVKSGVFDPDFFKRFDVVLNGLDNLDARRHVNRLCLAAEVPLVESGTAGYLGQVSVHIKGVSQCFECEPKAVPKTFPVCTIRNTPEKPIHCIVWAKDMLFATLFGPKGASELEEEDLPAGVTTEEEDATKETTEQLAERAAFFVRREGEGAAAFAARIYSRAFGADIERLLRITSLWEKPGRVAPTALPAADAGVAARVGELLSVSAASSSACASLGLCNQNALWSRDEAQAVFLLALARLAMLQQSHAGAPLTFDKDDALAVEFVAAAALLRGQNYGIPGQSLFAAKGMAGNIIHAIATTNAIISGLIVLQAIKVLRGQLAATRNVYLWQFPSVQRKGTRLLLPEPPQAPTPSCYVCERARMQVSLDLGSWTLGAFCEKVLAPKFGVLQPCLIHGQAFYFEHGEEGMEEDELAANAALRAKLLRDVPGGLKDGDILAVSDQATSLRFELKLMQRTQWDADTDNEGFLVQGEVCKPVAQDAGPAEPAEPAPAPEDDHAFQMLDEAPAEAAGAKRKRSTEAQEGAHAANKKGKAAGAAEEDDGFVMLD